MDSPQTDTTLRLKMRHKLVLSHVAIAVGALLLANGAAIGAQYLFSSRLPFERAEWGPYLTIQIICAAILALWLGLWASRPLARRLERISGVCRAWLRGDLTLRVADPAADDLGLLGGQLNLLAKHLQQDEQDLARLREHNARITDQVRALAVDEERERLARELHDGVKQHLFSLSMTANAIRTHLEGSSDAIGDHGTHSQGARQQLAGQAAPFRPHTGCRLCLAGGSDRG